MIKILLFPFTIFLISINANGQCTNPTSYGSATAPSSNTSVTISTCNFQGEYGTVTGVVAGGNLSDYKLMWWIHNSKK